MQLADALREAQGKNPNAWAVGRILEELSRKYPAMREIIEQDLDKKEMGLEACFEALKKHARAHAKDGCWACPVVEITPGNEAVKVIMDFYGLHVETGAETPDKGTEGAGFDLLDLL